MLNSMEWVRGETIGYGSFSTVSLAVPKNKGSGSLMAVKSCEVDDSVLLQNEEKILSQLGDCRNVIRCLGIQESVENRRKLFNLMLEYAGGGNLAQLVKKNGGCLQESEIRIYTRSILNGLSYIHSNGFVHCDLKLQNLLLCNDGELKIADFGLAKKTGEKQGRIEVRGTPLYMAPESVNENEYDSPCDIWALGCAVLEMFTGKTAWNCVGGNCNNIAALLLKIGLSDELPEIPQELSPEVKDFLSKCLVKDPVKRWTAEMLLDHPFVKEFSSSSSSSSPRCPFEFEDRVSIPNSSPNFELSVSGFDWSALSSSDSSSAADRIQQLVSDSDQVCDWSVSDGWITVR
ncbi:mitogen-activated protein kinase kinase kinase 20-like [Mercurialis annua]|uniref:mitogen-activated protein kinase kinase kinase 20-like n=1 Tax=Mercurialis annua TaxID=3986 RepID=UPI002160C428|nr:mitogen-activated protein kinase kinase kinase 20-like [Mercurialis annua]